MMSFESFFLIAGPCVIESEAMCREVAGTLKAIKEDLNIPILFKASFDKANRTSMNGFRGPGLNKGLAILERIKSDYDLPIVTDVHTVEQVAPVSEVADMLQTPAFLCRQTDFIHAVAQSNRPINLKKGQFLSPQEMQFVVEKAKQVTNQPVFACERGTTFGYHNLVVDFRGLVTMRSFAPVIFDATHSVQQPGGLNGASGGQREMVPYLAKAACAVGIDGLFLETHPDPEKALSDGPNMVSTEDLPGLLKAVMAIQAVQKEVEHG